MLLNWVVSLTAIIDTADGCELWVSSTRKYASQPISPIHFSHWSTRSTVVLTGFTPTADGVLVSRLCARLIPEPFTPPPASTQQNGVRVRLHMTSCFWASTSTVLAQRQLGAKSLAHCHKADERCSHKMLHDTSLFSPPATRSLETAFVPPDPLPMTTKNETCLPYHLTQPLRTFMPKKKNHGIFFFLSLGDFDLRWGTTGSASQGESGVRFEYQHEQMPSTVTGWRLWDWCHVMETRSGQVEMDRLEGSEGILEDRGCMQSSYRRLFFSCCIAH